MYKVDGAITNFDELLSTLIATNLAGKVNNAAWVKHTINNMMTAMLRLLIKDAAFIRTMEITTLAP